MIVPTLSLAGEPSDFAAAPVFLGVRLCPLSEETCFKKTNLLRSTHA